MLFEFIHNQCNNLKCDGVMTIGKYGFDSKTGPNPDFLALLKCHENICEKANLDPHSFNVSMGMSSDYKIAIEQGSTMIRVGSAIFGSR